MLAFLSLTAPLSVATTNKPIGYCSVQKLRPPLIHAIFIAFHFL